MSPEQLRLDEERRRTEGVVVKGFIGYMRFKDTFTIEEVTDRLETGVGTPLDLMPPEFWHDPKEPFTRFSEEILGKDF